MAQRGRPGLSASEKADLWERWKSGQSLSDIGRALGKHAGSIHGVVSSNGGIIPLARRRSQLALSLSEREEISRGLAASDSIRTIAYAIRRAPSTVSREIARNGGRHRYRASLADQKAWVRALRPKTCKLAVHRRLQRIVAEKLSLEWSPEQISGWLKQQYSADEEMRISHETIYRSLFLQARGMLKRELVRHLRTRRMMRRSKKASTRGQRRLALAVSRAARSSMQSRSTNGQLRSRIGRFLVTGKVTSLPVQATPTLRRLSSGSLGSPCW